jgi:hypothetical protein
MERVIVKLCVVRSVQYRAVRDILERRRRMLARRVRTGRGWLLAFALALVLATLGRIGDSGADDRTAFLIDRLKSDDFRVRTSAALALGGTNDDAAIQPLCGALADSSDVVRQSVAAALKRLGRASSLPCMKARLGVEPDSAVKLQITRAVESIQASAPAASTSSTGSPLAAPPKVVAGAKYYVALSPVANSTGRPQADIDRVVLTAVRAKLDSLPAYQLAPQGETPEAARAVLSRRSLKGYYLAISVDAFDYGGGNLKVKVKIAVFTYPGKDLRGEVPAGLTQTGVRAGDKGAEDNLMGMAGGRAFELFSQNFQ